MEKLKTLSRLIMQPVEVQGKGLGVAWQIIALKLPQVLESNEASKAQSLLKYQRMFLAIFTRWYKTFTKTMKD